MSLAAAFALLQTALLLLASLQSLPNATEDLKSNIVQVVQQSLMQASQAVASGVSSTTQFGSFPAPEGLVAAAASTQSSTVTCAMTVSPTTVSVNQPYTLTWTSSGATSAFMRWPSGNGINTSLNGSSSSMLATPNSYTYRLETKNAAGTVICTAPATVTVVADTTAPTVSIANPGAGASVSGSVSVSVNAADNLGVAGVQLKIDGQNFGAEDTSAPYAAMWNTTAVPDGSHTITAVARDWAGNVTTAVARTVNVTNNPGTPTACRAPRYYRYILDTSVPLKCANVHGAYNTTIFSTTTPDTGRALGRVRLTYRNNASTSDHPGFNGGVYSWLTKMTVGNGSSHSTSEAMCPSTSPREQLVSFGYVNQATGQNLIEVKSQLTRGTGCVDGKIAVFGGGVLEVWVEDPQPHCAGKDIMFSTTYGSTSPNFGVTYVDPYGVNVGWVWPNGNVQTKINSLSIPATETARSKLKVMASVNGSPRNTPELACGLQTAKAATELKTPEGASLGFLDQVIPTAQHMGHFNLSLYNEVLTGVNESRVLEMFVKTDVANGVDIFTGGCCGAANIGAVREE